MQRRTDMQPIGIFFTALLGLGVIGVFVIMAVNHFRKGDDHVRRTLRPKGYDSREMYEE
jgi:hypothetical protein